MFKRFLITLATALSLAGPALAAVDVNKASEAELDGIKGIGPATTAHILEERQKSPFKDWDDFVGRVKGVGPSTAAKFSSEGLTVNGKRFKGPKEDKKKEKAPASKNKDSGKKAAEPAASSGK